MRYSLPFSTDVRRDRLGNNARALASAILMPETTIRQFVESLLPKFTDERGHVLVDELASAISHEYDVNFKTRPAAAQTARLSPESRVGIGLDMTPLDYIATCVASKFGVSAEVSAEVIAKRLRVEKLWPPG